MNTTTKCQHAAVFITLATLLIILACVAFLAPVTSYHGHPNDKIEPVTQVVTNPPGYDEFWDGTTSRYDRRHTTRNSRTTRHRSRDRSSTRHGSHHSTDRPGQFDFDAERERDFEEFPVAAGGAVGAAAVGGAAFAAGYDHEYDDFDDGADRRVGHGHDGDREDDGRDRYGHTTSRSRSRTRHTTPDRDERQATRTTNHRQRSRTTTESSRHRDRNDEGHERDSDDRKHEHDHKHAHADAPTAALHASLPPHGGPARQKRDAGEKRDHGFVSMERDDEHPKGPRMMMHGHVKDLTPGEVYAISMHQFGDMQNGCDHMGPAFNEGPYAMPLRRKVFAELAEEKLEREKRSKDESDSEGHRRDDEDEHDEGKSHGKSHKKGGALMGFLKANDDGEGEFEFPVPKHHQEACATCGNSMGRGVSLQKVKGIPKLKQKAQEKIAKMKDYLAKFGQHNRKKRALKPSSSLSSTNDQVTLGDYYHHRMNPVTPEEIAADAELYRKIGMLEMNELAYNNTLNGTAMAGYMEPPCACGVFARSNDEW